MDVLERQGWTVGQVWGDPSGAQAALQSYFRALHSPATLPQFKFAKPSKPAKMDYPGHPGDPRVVAPPGVTYKKPGTISTTALDAKYSKGAYTMNGYGDPYGDPFGPPTSQSIMQMGGSPGGPGPSLMGMPVGDTSRLGLMGPLAGLALKGLSALAGRVGLPALGVGAAGLAAGGIADLMTPGGLFPDVIDMPWNTPPFGVGTARTWMAGNQKFYQLDDGSIATRKKNGVWKRWRPYRSVVLGKKISYGQMARATRKLRRHADATKTILRITMPRRKRR